MESWEDRLRNEAAELNERITKLSGFIGGAVYELLSEADQNLLVLQLSTMNNYMAVLTIRLNRILENEI